MWSVSRFINARKLQSQKSNFTTTMSFFQWQLHSERGRTCAWWVSRGYHWADRHLLQSSEVQLRALVGASSPTVLGGVWDWVQVWSVELRTSFGKC